MVSQIETLALTESLWLTLRDGRRVCLLTLGCNAENPRSHCAGDSGGAVTVAGGGMTAIDMSLVFVPGIVAT